MDLRALRYFVAVAEERHVGRAAARLHMTQPPLSRAMHRLEAELGVQLLERTATGVTLTDAAKTLLVEARTTLRQVERLTARVRATAGAQHLAIGSLADAADLVASRLVAPFRARHPDAVVTVHEFDLSDPTAGLRAHAVDVALTRTPFDATGLRTHTLARQPVGVVVADSDPLCGATAVSVDRLTDRRWVRLPGTADPAWLSYWSGPTPDADLGEVRTIQECLQSTLWDGTSAIAPLDQVLPPGLTVVPADDREPSHLVLAWRDADDRALVRSFVDLAARGFPPSR